MPLTERTLKQSYGNWLDQTNMKDMTHIRILKTMGAIYSTKIYGKFRSKPEWISLVQPEKFRKNQTIFPGGPLFSVGPVQSKWTVPFDLSQHIVNPSTPLFSICHVQQWRNTLIIAAFMDCWQWIYQCYSYIHVQLQQVWSCFTSQVYVLAVNSS